MLVKHVKILTVQLSLIGKSLAAAGDEEGRIKPAANDSDMYLLLCVIECM